MNSHGTNTTRSLVLLVCQFRHFRERMLYYQSTGCLSTSFFTFSNQFSTGFQTVWSEVSRYFPNSLNGSFYEKSSDILRSKRHPSRRKNAGQLLLPGAPYGFWTGLFSTCPSAGSYATFSFAMLTSSAKPFASLTAISARTLRFSSMPLCLRPNINLL